MTRAVARTDIDAAAAAGPAAAAPVVKDKVGPPPPTSSSPSASPSSSLGGTASAPLSADAVPAMRKPFHFQQAVGRVGTGAGAGGVTEREKEREKEREGGSANSSSAQPVAAHSDSHSSGPSSAGPSSPASPVAARTMQIPAFHSATGIGTTPSASGSAGWAEQALSEDLLSSHTAASSSRPASRGPGGGSTASGYASSTSTGSATTPASVAASRSRSQVHAHMSKITKIGNHLGGKPKPLRSQSAAVKGPDGRTPRKDAAKYKDWASSQLAEWQQFGWQGSGSSRGGSSVSHGQGALAPAAESELADGRTRDDHIDE